ncbi:hypothetical protein HMPREF0889_0285 [Megasphaera lornae]|uniref:Uncharacterized protein n=1 Tax=Megasphaera lornae TaxID=1000568 RepID=D3LVG1_9FIRM|nr:hypothetical protein [Megasphaera genomosp. type_1]EFD93888.1 hypothetical protein HMPREF0889_0285 [Megasphaera genomosp. type_1 str. 28L]
MDETQGTQEAQGTQQTQGTQQAQGTQQTQQTQQTPDTVFQNSQQTALGQNAQTQGQNGQNQGQDGQTQGQQQAPETYDFTKAVTDVYGEGGELDAETTKQFTEQLKQLNATQEQANTIAKFGLEYAKSVGQATMQAVHQAYEKQISDWGEQSKKELGVDFEKKVAQATVTRGYLDKLIPNFTEMLNQTGAGNHIAMIKALAALSEFIKEDSGTGTGTGASMNNSIYDNTDFSKY